MPASSETPDVLPVDEAAEGEMLERTAWRRESDAQDINARLGQRIRQHREGLGMSLKVASKVTGIPGATLSRIENNRMAPTMPVILKVLTGLRMAWADLMSDLPSQAHESQVSVAASGEGEQVEVQGNIYTVPHGASTLRNHIQPIIFETGARTVEEAGGLRGHAGAEFCMVLSGTLTLHFVDRSPLELAVGASALFNGEIPHAYVAKNRGRVRVLLVNAVDPLIRDPSEVLPILSGLRLSPNDIPV